jgi:hypothetical protein
MPARYDYGPAKKPAAPTDIEPPGKWHAGMFWLAPGVSLADFQFACPYGNHFVDFDDLDIEDDFHEGYCDVCQREVEIDYAPNDVIVHASERKTTR